MPTFSAVVGKMKGILVVGAAPRKILALSLQDWAEYLAADKIVATMHVDEDDPHMEGPY